MATKTLGASPMQGSNRSRRGGLGKKRKPLANLTNLSSASASRALLKPQPPPVDAAPAGSASSIGSSAPGNPRGREIAADRSVVAERRRDNDKYPVELEAFNDQLEKIKKISKRKVENGNMLPCTSSHPCHKISKKTSHKQHHKEPLENNVGESIPSQNFMEKQRAYFAEIDAFELLEEFVSESDLE